MRLTFKIILDKRRKSADNTFPVKLRVYSQSDYKEAFLGFKVKPEEWNDTDWIVLSANPNYEVFNAKIQTERVKVQKLILLADLNSRELTPEDLIAAVNPKPSEPQKKVVKPSIVKYGEDLVKSLTASGKVGNAFVYSCAVNKLKSYVGHDRLTFEELNYKKLTEFNNSMLADGIKVNTVSVYMRTIRAIYNKAIKEGIVPTTSYPFTAFRIKNERTVSRTLTLQEFKSIVSLELPVNTPIWHWRNYFLLSFCFIGMNFSDLLTLKESNIIDGRVIFRRKKTGKIYSIKMTEKAIEILKVYRGKNNPDALMLPVLKQTKDLVKLKKDVWQAIKTCNEYLDRIAEKSSIEKGITTYYARYSWANIARSLGYSKDMIAEALGHEYGNRVTGIYLDNYDNEVIDLMNQKVIDIVVG